MNEDSGIPLSSPSDAAEKNGRIYISDSGAGKVLILNNDFDDLHIERKAAGAVAGPLALAAGLRAAEDTFLAVDSGAVVEVELPVDTPESVWEAMKTELAAADFQGALEYIW